MATASLSVKYLFGLAENVSGNVAFVDENIIAYCVGKCVAFYNILEKRERFIQATEIGNHITALALCPNSRVIAVAEHGILPCVNIYDLSTLRKRKCIDLMKENHEGRVVSMQLSHQSQPQMLVTLEESSYWQLTLWDWSKVKALATIIVCDIVSSAPTSQIHLCSFSPMDSSLLCCTVDGILHFFCFNESTVNRIPQSEATSTENHVYTTHCWLRTSPNRLLVGTESGYILLYYHGTLVSTIHTNELYTVTGLISYRNGFIVGFSNESYQIYETSTLSSTSSSTSSTMLMPTTDTLSFIKTQMLNKMEGFGVATCLSLSPSEDRLLASTNQKQIIILSMGDMMAKKEWKLAIVSFHKKGIITGLDVCERKSIAATCSTDGTVRIWNYTEMQQLVCHVYEESLIGVALHPSGHEIAIATPEKLYLMHILVGDLKVQRIISVKHCGGVKFSNGGQFVAVLSGNIVCIYSFYTLEKVADFKGHTGKVNDIFWGENDLYMISCSADGAVYRWVVDEAKRSGEFIQKGTSFLSAISNGEMIYTVSSDSVLRELDCKELAVIREISLKEIAISKMTILCGDESSTLFIGTGVNDEFGSVRGYNLPLLGASLDPNEATEEKMKIDFAEYVCMSTPVSHLISTSDGKYLIATDECGSMCVFDIKGGRYEKCIQSGGCGSEMVCLAKNEEVLVSRVDYEDKSMQMTDLIAKADELALQNDYQLRLKDMNDLEEYNEVLKNLTIVLEEVSEKCNSLYGEKEELRSKTDSEYEHTVERNQYEIQTLEKSQQQELMDALEMFQEFYKEKKALQIQWDDEECKLIKKQEESYNDLLQNLTKKLEDDKELSKKLEKKANVVERTVAESMRQLEEDIDCQVAMLKERYELQLTTKQEEILRYKGENGIMGNKFSVLGNDIVDQKDEICSLHDKERELQDEKKNLEQEIVVQMKEMKARDDIISEKEKNIYELKRRNQELEKFKYVLDYKIKELKEEIEPRERAISATKNKILEMDSQLEQYHKNNVELDELIGLLRKKIDKTHEETVRQRLLLVNQKTRRRSYQKRLVECVDYIQDKNKLKVVVSELFGNEKLLSKESNDNDDDLRNEYRNHNDYLEKCIHTLENELIKRELYHKDINKKLLNENTSLTEDIRKEKAAKISGSDVSKVTIKELKDMKSPQKSNNTGSKLKNKLKISERTADVLKFDPLAQIESNRAKIDDLRMILDKLEGRVY